MKVEILGTIVPDDLAEVYDFFGWAYTCPKDIVLPDTEEEVEVRINSYGGDVYAGAEIYTRLKEHKGKVTVIISGLAASMASVIAMAGDEVKMSPVGCMMLHNVSTYAEGDKNAMSHESEVLHNFDQIISNAYRMKTGMDQDSLLDLMNQETWLTPQEAMAKGFIDEILFDDKEAPLLVAGMGMLPKKAVETARKALAMKKEKLNQGEDLEEEKTEEEVDQNKATEEPVNAEEEEKEEEEEGEDEEEEEEKDEDEEEEEEEEKAKAKAMSEKEAKINAAVHCPAMPKFKNEAEMNQLHKVAEGAKHMGNHNTYKEVFLNAIRGKQLDQGQQRILEEANQKMSNAFTHDTTNTALVIPRETQDKIWARATEGYGVLADVNRLHVHGELRVVKHTGIAEGDAAWYVEATPTADEKNTFGELILKGHELSKAVTISWKLRAMAMDDFEDFLIREISDRMSIALGTAVTQGDGKNQPTGILTALKDKKDQKVSVAKKGALTYDELLKAIAKVHSSYKAGAKIYANSNVIWTVIANVVDKNGRPFFEVNSTQDGVGNALGFTVKEDASLKDTEIIIGNPSKGYVFNVNEDMSMTTEEHAKERRTDFVSYMVADGNVLDEKAFAVLSLAPEASEPSSGR